MNRFSGKKNIMFFFVFAFVFLAQVLPANAQENQDHHAQSDAYWARLAQSYPAFEVDPTTLREAAANELIALGAWGPVLDWPHIPVSAAHLPDGRILTWASNEEDGFPGGRSEFTYAAAWDPTDSSFKMLPHTSHDMFCAHQTMLEDGRLLVMGGRNTVNLTSIFDPKTDSWITEDPMANGRWYPTAVTVPNGEVMVAVGSGGGSYPEIWNEDNGWRTLSGINMNAPILNYTGYYENNWWPLLHVAPDGDVFHSGPTPDMHRINTSGEGTITKVGPQITDWYPKHGATVMYDEGKLLVAGGAISGSNQASSNKAITIDINGTVPVVSATADMHHARKFQNGVMLPTGEVLIVGGNTSGLKFNDSGTVLAAEMWDPETGIWTELPDMAVPRNYHSVALLMTDGRVWVGGGGLCGSGCAANHMDAQVYSPGYLYNENGSLATRPVISSAPEFVRNGTTATISATAGLAEFSMIKMSSTTHGVNSDVRFVNVDFTENGAGSYDLAIHANKNVVTPGYWMLFGMDANGVPSEAAVVQVSTEGLPNIANPGTQVFPEGTNVTIPINVTGVSPFSYAATGLPAGLSINSNNGEISGVLPDGSAGSYDVDVTVTNEFGSSLMSFNLQVTTGATGQILREWWTGISGNDISLLTSDSGYPDNPDGSDFLTKFEAPADWADNYGTRVRGYIHPVVSGSYTFWIATDDNGELWLSTDANPDNKSRIAHVPGWANDHDWYKYGEQQSSTITLTAGQRYYVELLQKEGGGLDNIAVAWQQPGGSLEIISGDYLSPYTGAEIELENPGDQDGAEGEAVALTMNVTLDTGLPVSFSASGLPDGVSIEASTGKISGGLLAGSAGTASVTVTATDGVATDAVSFNWNINAAPGNWIEFEDDTNASLTLTSVPETDGVEKDIAVGDLNQDGWDDVIVVRKEGFMGTGARADLLLMNESGTLVDRTSEYAAGFAAEHSIARDVLIQDLDGDGWDDVLIVNTFGDQPNFYRNLGSTGGAWLGLANESTQRIPQLDVSMVQFCAAAAGDVNGDGHPDLYFSNYIMDGTTEDFLLINDGTGHFTDQGQSLLGDLIDVAFGTQANIIDIDNDGDNDIVKLSANQPAGPFGNDGIFILYNDGTGNFTNWSTVPSNDAYMYIIGDFNNDDQKDFYIVDDAADYVNMSDGVTANSNVNFVQHTTPWVRTAGHGANLRIADLDHDGDLDLGVADVDTSVPPCEATDLRSFVLLQNEGNATGTFVDPYGAADKPWSTNMYDFAFVDVDKDGNLDLFSAQCSGYALYKSTQDPITPPREPVTLNLGDLNLGIAAHDQREGTGYIMYSEESVHTRFVSTPPSGGNADHLIAVVYDNGEWKVDRNKRILIPFTPQASDYLLARVDFGANTVEHLEGQSFIEHGMNAGYESGDLVVSAEMWSGQPNEGEFGVEGAQVVVLSSDGNSSPVLADIDNQLTLVNEMTSLMLNATDSNDDELHFAASGLPTGLNISGNEISGVPTVVGAYTTSITVTDGNGGSDNVSFVWTITSGDPGSTSSLTLGELNLGIAAHDSRTGMGYVMYSEESVHTRFADNPPSGGNADHLISVVFEGGEWKVDRNKRILVPFTPRATDHLVAEINFGADEVTHLVGVATIIDGINAGYISGNLTVTAEMWGGQPNGGEFGVEGTSIEIAAEIAQGQRLADQLVDFEEIPEAYELGDIYPNPFNQSTVISYKLAEDSPVDLEVYSITGQRVRVLMEGQEMPAGSWQSRWDGTDDSGRKLAAGIYMIRFHANGFQKVGKVVLIK